MKASSKVILNTGFLYGSMIVTVCVSLLSTRWVLEALGEKDYGIYSLIANIVAMFAFLNVAMAAATQRYLSFSIGEGKKERVKETFYYSAIMHFVIGFIVFFLLELGGAWLVNNILDIPPSRLVAARNLLHFVATSSFFTVIAVPYEGMLNAREHMGVIAIINIVDSLLKLGTAFFLLHTHNDRLIFYGTLLMGVSICTFLLKFSYCQRNYPEVKIKLHPISDWKLFRQMTSFATWNLIGTGCGVARNQGVAVLINPFFGIVTNAAYGLSQQVYGMLNFFSNTIVRAIRPQIIKSEGAGEHERMLRLSSTTCKMTFLLLSLLVIPLFNNITFILDLWLDNDYPQDTILFCKSFLLISLIYQLTIGLQIAIESTGRIRLLQMVVGSMHILALPAGYICFRMGLPVSSIMLCIIAEEFISLIFRIIIAQHLTGLNAYHFIIHLITPCTLVITAALLMANCISSFIASEWISIIIVTIFNGLFICIAGYLFCLSKEERQIFKGLFLSIRKKLPFLVIFLSFIPLTSCAETEEPFDTFTPLNDYSLYIQEKGQEAIFQQAILACQTSPNQGKSVGVFGGSLSSLPESRIAKGLWKKYLYLDIKTYGKGGHGFSINQGSIQNQVNKAAKHDIYILWASTNDYTAEQPIGEVTDYTEYDGYDESKRTTQCGGINYCIKKLREKNPDCIICIFTSLKFFGTDAHEDYGYKVQPINMPRTGHSFYEYIEKQKECAILQQIPFFEQWNEQERIDQNNYHLYYKNDGYHMNEFGYFDIGIRQLLFLAQIK